MDLGQWRLEGGKENNLHVVVMVGAVYAVVENSRRESYCIQEYYFLLVLLLVENVFFQAHCITIRNPFPCHILPRYARNSFLWASWSPGKSGYMARNCLGVFKYSDSEGDYIGL